MTTAKKNNKNIFAGLLTATAASLCCITPVIAILGGASGFAASFEWIEAYRPYLIGLTVVIFAFAWYQQLQPKKQADCNCDLANKNSFLHSKIFLVFATIVSALMLAFPYYAKAFYSTKMQAQVATNKKQNLRKATFYIKGMTCEGCTAYINSRLAKVSGVIQYQTSYEQAKSIVQFDQQKNSADSIAAAINRTGYTVISQTITSIE